MVLPWRTRYRKDKASIRGAIVPGNTLKECKEVFPEFLSNNFL
jgi:hypothetical protein